MSNIDGFVKELAELTKKYGIYLEANGCACCYDTNLLKIEDGQEIGLSLTWEGERYSYRQK